MNYTPVKQEAILGKNKRITILNTTIDIQEHYNSKFSIRIPHCWLRMLVFIAYNCFYVLYMQGLAPQSLYFTTLIVFCVMNVFVVIITKHGFINAIREFKLGTGYVAVILIISLIIQLIHFDFESYLMTGVIRLFLPIINAFLFVNSIDKRDQDLFFNILLLRFAIHFLIANYTYLNLTSIMSISWGSSFSPMESSMAHDFMIMEMYYLYRKDRKRALLCMVFCMLSIIVMLSDSGKVIPCNERKLINMI